MYLTLFSVQLLLKIRLVSQIYFSRSRSLKSYQLLRRPPNIDPVLAQKKASALKAMATLGLPTELFVPFSVGNALTFSPRLSQVRPFLAPTVPQGTVAKPLEDEYRHSRPGSFLIQQ